MLEGVHLHNMTGLASQRLSESSSLQGACKCMFKSRVSALSDSPGYKNIVNVTAYSWIKALIYYRHQTSAFATMLLYTMQMINISIWSNVNTRETL